MKVPSDDDLQDSAAQLATQLLRLNSHMATAESCTGGWIAKVCTDLAGSSAWFNGGLVTYTNAAKQRLAGVDPELLVEHGAVSGPVVLAMAAGAQRALAAQWSVAVSGIAGPAGASDDKPVGTVWVAWGTAGRLRAECYLFEGDREAVRRQTVHVAMRNLIQALQAV